MLILTMIFMHIIDDYCLQGILASMKQKSWWTEQKEYKDNDVLTKKRGLTMGKSCFGCIHQDIRETSHEWIECKCGLDGQWHNPFSGCDKCEEPAPIVAYTHNK